MPAKLSLAMIVRDEELLIRRCLESAAEVCDEMIVVDTGSEDRTMEIARNAGAEVHELTWKDDFATARNASFAWCNYDWIMWLDADDVLPEATRAEIRRLKAEGFSDDVDIWTAPYYYAIADDGTPITQLPRERIIRRSAGHRWEGRIHECIPLENSRNRYDPRLVIEHRPDLQRRAQNRFRNIRILEAEMAGGHPTVRTRFYYGNELFDHGRYDEAIAAYRDYLATDRRDTPDRYWALIATADAARQTGDADLVKQASVDAIKEDPSRAEGFVSLGRWHFDRQEWAKALPSFTAATAAIRPGATHRSSDYLYGPWDYLSVCLEKLGRLSEALAASQRALPRNPQADRIRSNMRWIADHL